MKQSIVVDVPDAGALDTLMRYDCFGALWPLFRKAAKPAKELTESYSALARLKRYVNLNNMNVVHVGDGAHARTGALFAFMTKSNNVSVDPQTNLAYVHAWQNRYNVERFSAIRSRVQDVQLSAGVDVVTFVHAHVDVDEVLSEMGGPLTSWRIAYTLSCCHPSKQLSKKYKVLDEGEDWRVLSDKRRYQIIVNTER